MRSRVAAIALLALVVIGCVPRPRGERPFAVTEVTPAFLSRMSAVDPALAVHGERVALTWVARQDDGGADVWLAMSADSGATFGEPRRLNPANGRVSSYAESRPVVALGADGLVIVAWAAKRDSGEYADDIVARTSRDGGASFDPPAFVNDDHADPRSTYHGFLALDLSPEGAATLAWIDGRAAAATGVVGEPASCEIMTSTSRDRGATWPANVRAADSVCSCCRLALRSDAGGRVALAYRTSRMDLRDPRLALSRDGGASFALDTLLFADGWRLSGCPSHGPALSLGPGGGHVAWYSGADEREGVHVARWRNDGALATPPHHLDVDLRKAGRPMLASFGRDAVAGLLGEPAADSTRRVLGVRVVHENGRLGAWALLGLRAKTAALAGDGGARVWAAWSDETPEGPRLRVARLEAPAR